MRTRIICLAAAGAFAAASWLTPPASAKDAPAKSAAMDSDRSDKRVEKLKKKLDLTDEQAAKLKEAWKGQREAVKPLRERMKKELEQLKTQVDKKASDSEIQATLDQLKASREEMRAQMKKTLESTEAILTPTQRAKMALTMAKKRRKMFGWLRGKHEEEEPE